jgi:hypothetical protein
MSATPPARLPSLAQSRSLAHNITTNNITTSHHPDESPSDGRLGCNSFRESMHPPLALRALVLVAWAGACWGFASLPLENTGVFSW